MPQRQSYCPKTVLSPLLQTVISSTKTKSYKSKGNGRYIRSLCDASPLRLAQSNILASKCQKSVKKNQNKIGKSTKNKVKWNKNAQKQRKIR
jgi:hypothetical protein